MIHNREVFFILNIDRVTCLSTGATDCNLFSFDGMEFNSENP